MNWDRRARKMSDQCWRCQTPMRANQMACPRCGATRASTKGRAQGRQGRQRPQSRQDDYEMLPGGAVPMTDKAPAYVPNRPHYGPQSRPRRVAAPWNAVPPPPEPEWSVMPEQSWHIVPEPSWQDDPGPPVPEWSLPRRRQARPETDEPLSAHPIFVQLGNFAFATGFGLLGAALGAICWMAFALHFNFHFGFPAVLMGYLTGQGVTMGSSVRSAFPTLLAMTLTVGVWTLCQVFLLHNGFELLPTEFVFLLAALAGSVAPTRMLPLDEP